MLNKNVSPGITIVICKNSNDIFGVAFYADKAKKQQIYIEKYIPILKKIIPIATNKKYTYDTFMGVIKIGVRCDTTIKTRQEMIQNASTILDEILPIYDTDTDEDSRTKDIDFCLRLGQKYRRFIRNGNMIYLNGLHINDVPLVEHDTQYYTKTKIIYTVNSSGGSEYYFKFIKF